MMVDVFASGIFDVVLMPNTEQMLPACLLKGVDDVLQYGRIHLLVLDFVVACCSTGLERQLQEAQLRQECLLATTNKSSSTTRKRTAFSIGSRPAEGMSSDG